MTTSAIRAINAAVTILVLMRGSTRQV